MIDMTVAFVASVACMFGGIGMGVLFMWDYRVQARHLMDYIIASQQGKYPHTGYSVASTHTPVDPASLELDRATRIYQSALMRGEIGESDLDELARAGGVTEPVRQ